MKLLDRQIIDNLQSLFKGQEMIILESQLPAHPSSGCSFLASQPVNQIVAYGSHIEQTVDGRKVVFEMNPWEALHQFREKYKGWMFGYLGYDLKNFVEDLSSRNNELARVPDMYFMQPATLIKVENGELEQIHGNHDLSFIQARLRRRNTPFSNQTFVPGISKQQYISKIIQIKDLIREGDFYELNFSYPLSGTYSSDPYDLYFEMRSVNPVPFGAYLRLGNFSVCCSSPERFLKKTGDRIISEPIKGTAERGENTETDLLRIGELKSEKNRAENLMIVDLVRHDFSRVSEPGSVRVTKLFDVQSFGTVHQLISTVESVIRKDKNVVDVIKCCFPMGSMTGAPKIEVMRQIEDLENYRRGIYSGAIGYITPDDDFDFNVVIRTAILQNEKLIYPVGGAITSDSDPDLEWWETIIKSKNLTEVFSSDYILRNEVPHK